MDPLSITAGVVALLTAATKVGWALKDFHEGVAVVDTKIKGLLYDVENFTLVIRTIKDTLEQDNVKTSLQTTGHIGSHFRNLNTSIDDGHTTLSQLQNTLERVNKSVTVLDGPRKQLRLRAASEEIMVFQLQVRSCRDTLHLSLQAITLWNQVSFQESNDLILPNLADIHQTIRRLAIDLNERIATLQNAVESTSRNDQLRTLTNSRNCVRSAATVISSASTALGLDNADRRSVADGSEFGDVFPDERNETMERWISSNTVFEYGEVESESTLIGSNSEVNQGSAPMKDSDFSDSDAELEEEIVQSMYAKAKLKWSEGDHAAAERLLETCLNRIATNSMLSGSQVKLKSMIIHLLVTTYYHQKRWEKLQPLIMERVAQDARGLSKGGNDPFFDMKCLAECLCERGEYAEALLYGRKALKGYRRIGQSRLDYQHSTLELLVRICQAAENPDEAEAYQAILKKSKQAHEVSTSTSTPVEESAASSEAAQPVSKARATLALRVKALKEQSTNDTNSLTEKDKTERSIIQSQIEILDRIEAGPDDQNRGSSPRGTLPKLDPRIQHTVTLSNEAFIQPSATERAPGLFPRGTPSPSPPSTTSEDYIDFDDPRLKDGPRLQDSYNNDIDSSTQDPEAPPELSYNSHRVSGMNPFKGPSNSPSKARRGLPPQPPPARRNPDVSKTKTQALKSDYPFATQSLKSSNPWAILQTTPVNPWARPQASQSGNSSDALQMNTAYVERQISDPSIDLLSQTTESTPATSSVLMDFNSSASKPLAPLPIARATSNETISNTPSSYESTLADVRRLRSTENLRITTDRSVRASGERIQFPLVAYKAESAPHINFERTNAVPGAEPYPLSSDIANVTDHGMFTDEGFIRPARYIPPVYDRVLILGKPQVGKSSLISALERQYPLKEPYVRDSFDRQISYMDGVKRHVFTFEEALESPRYLKNLKAIIVCFSIGEKGSRDNLPLVVQGLGIAKLQGQIPIVLAGLQEDALQHDRFIISRQDRVPYVRNFLAEAHRLKRSIQASSYVQCSAHTGEGLADVLKALVDAKIPNKSGNVLRIIKRKNAEDTIPEYQTQQIIERIDNLFRQREQETLIRRA